MATVASSVFARGALCHVFPFRLKQIRWLDSKSSAFGALPSGLILSRVKPMNNDF